MTDAEAFDHRLQQVKDARLSKETGTPAPCSSCSTSGPSCARSSRSPSSWASARSGAPDATTEHDRADETPTATRNPAAHHVGRTPPATAGEPRARAIHQLHADEVPRPGERSPGDAEQDGGDRGVLTRADELGQQRHRDDPRSGVEHRRHQCRHEAARPRSASLHAYRGSRAAPAAVRGRPGRRGQRSRAAGARPTREGWPGAAPPARRQRPGPRPGCRRWCRRWPAARRAARPRWSRAPRPGCWRRGRGPARRRRAGRRSVSSRRPGCGAGVLSQK